MEKIKWLNVLIPIGGILLLFTLLRPCKGEEVMKCNYSVSVAVLLFTVIAVANMLALWKKEGKALVPLVSILISGESILVPAKIIGGCMMPGMACRAKSFPGIYVCSLIVIVIGVLDLLLQIRKRGYEYEK